VTQLIRVYGEAKQNKSKNFNKYGTKAQKQTIISLLLDVPVAA